MTDKMRESFEDNEFYYYKNPDTIGDILAKDEEGEYIDKTTFDRYELYKIAYKEGMKGGLREATKRCWEISEYYATCAEDGQADEYQCSDIAHGAERCVQAIEKLQEQDNG